MSTYQIKHLPPFHEGPGDPDLRTVKPVWNPTKSRLEWWHRCTLGDREWVLREVRPGRVWEESFIGELQFVAAILGVMLDRSWSTNGQPAPSALDFVAANEIGGGLVLRSRNTGNDWVALHTGASYPLTVAKSPHLHIRSDIVDTLNVFMLGGLVGASGLNTTTPGAAGAWTTPDDGIWAEYDTDVDGNIRFVTSSGGIQTVTPLGPPPAGHSTFFYVVNDAGTEAKLIMNGSIVATHPTNLPTVQLKPLAMIGTREAATKDLHLHDLRLIFDRGF